MIKLEKGPVPEVLQENSDQWKETLLEKLSLGTATPAEKARYRHPQIKAALEAETFGKCAYCESKLKHVHHGDVEHIVPKSLKPELTFKWENLTLACEICNQNKSDKDPEHFQILDPYITDPNLHFMFLGAFIADVGTPQGICTRLILDLDRSELVERRREKLDKIISILGRVSRTDLPIEVRKAILNNARTQDGAVSAEYSAMVNTVLNEFLRHLPSELRDAGCPTSRF